MIYSFDKYVMNQNMFSSMINITNPVFELAFYQLINQIFYFTFLQTCIVIYELSRVIGVGKHAFWQYRYKV